MDVIASTVGVVLFVLLVFSPFILIGLLIQQVRKNNAIRRQSEQARQAQLIAAAINGQPAPAVTPVPWWKR